MNKQQFISGMYFKIKESDLNVYKLESSSNDSMYVSEVSIRRDGTLVEWSSGHVVNVESIGSKRFKGYTSIMGKQVNVEFYYSDLIPFTPVEVVD